MNFEELKREANAEWAEFTGPERPRVLVGAATCGRAAGALETAAAFREALREHFSEDEVSVTEVGCLGLCFAEVLVEIRERNGRRVLYSRVRPADAPKLVKAHLVKGEPPGERAFAVMDGPPLAGVPRFAELPVVKPQVRVVMRNCGRTDPNNLNHYLARGGFSGLARALSLSPDEVIAEIKASGLRGRGGAGFPTGRKWEFARCAAGEEKYVVCNADEGDPGAFMDRSVLEGDPYAVLEGLITAGYAIGAGVGYVYARAEYPLALERLHTAAARLREKELLGRNIMESDFSFEIRIARGAGAFVCGEETALMAGIEGRRGTPRPRPPFPAVSGLFGKPTNINNVETLAAVSAIMEKGADWYAGLGVEKSRGTKTFALAGKIKRTGLIEVPMGVPLRTIIEEIGGGVPDDGSFKAVQTGGPSGGCLPARFLDLPVDYEHLAEVGSIIGSGGMIVMDERSCMVDVARYFLTFTESESCGKCVPCRTGTRHLLTILTDIAEGRGRPEHLEQLKAVGETMRKCSLCGLGGTAPNPVLTTVEYFEDEYRAHIEDKKCPAGVCRALISFRIDAEKCTGCQACARGCPAGAITGEKKKPHVIAADLCVRCGLCREACKFDSVIVE